jgi:hypothetical protein
MKQNTFICLLFLLVLLCGPLFAADAQLNGVLDSTINYTTGAGDAQEHSFGLEEYANLRLRISTGGKATLFSAFNLIALSGNYLENAAMLGTLNPNPLLGSTPLIYGQNYAAALELERLYFRINGDYIDTEAGLLRIPFGYSQVWGSMDFLNPRNPLYPNARPRGVLGLTFSHYPADSLKLLFFTAGPKDPLKSDGGGFIPGLSLDQHWDRASVQALYAYETPGQLTQKKGIHRFGLSLKADLELGFVVDALYTLNPDKVEGIEGLSAGTGFDYNFFDGDVYLLMEYLYNGLSSATALGFGGSWSNNHYLYGTALYRCSDYCNLSLSTILCFDDLSFSPFITFNYEFFQGFSMNLSAHLPMDQKTLNGGKPGELGPLPVYPDGSEGTTGARFILNAGVKLRF